MLFTQLKFSPNTVILRLAPLRFFYIHVLKRGWSIAETPYPKLYATGARRAEAAHVKIGDIDSQRVVVHIRGGTGGLDRDVMLSPKLLAPMVGAWVMPVFSIGCASAS